MDNRALPNLKHEQFAGCVAKGNEAHNCYLGIYGKDDEAVAVALINTPTIKARIQEIMTCRQDNAYIR